MTAYDFSHAPPDAVAYHRAAQRLFNTETEAAHGHLVGAKKNCEVGTRSALPSAIDGIELAAPHQPRLARKFQAPGITRA